MSDGLVRRPALSPVEECGELNAAMWGTRSSFPKAVQFHVKILEFFLSRSVSGFVGNTEMNKVMSSLPFTRVVANSSLSVSVDTKAVLPCPPDNPTALVVTWTISPRDQPPCTRAHRRDNNETSERNCTDARISWESRPDQNPALQIDPVAITHDGCYRCEVAAADGLFGHTYYLRVLVPPKVTLFRGINGTVVCRAAAGKPSAQIFWTPEGDCDTEEEPLGNGTVTVESKCHWEDLQVSNVSCSVSHVTGNKSLFLELETGDQLSLNLTILYITSSISVALVIAGSIWLWRIGCCRYSGEMQSYVSYTEKNTPLNDAVSK
ncbi:cell surface glycoprotein CD200 receptor 1-like [Neovison vison]|uniref:cell surface glycoprotein CD200 receptor 1-like n=1 Tax=Neovison vison TaxID=452646 RepID=UPI001CF0043F|nr:cell surface glycoprotein CD200 receptor 1-like [Neogale vison]